MYPELGHRPLNRLGVSNRAYVLEKSVPYLAAAVSAGVVGLGPLLAMGGLRGGKKRRINASALSWSEVTPSGNLVPSLPPSSVSSISGDGSVLTDPFTKGNKQYILVGADTDRNFSASVYLGATRGWGFMSKYYRQSRLFFNPVTVLAGDIFTTSSSTSTAPSHITGQTFTTLNSDYLRNYDTLATTVAKLNDQALSTLNIQGTMQNVSSHFCFPVGLAKGYGAVSQSSGRHTPIGIDDVFSVADGLSYTEWLRLQNGKTGTASAGTNSDVALAGPWPDTIGTSKDYGAYITIEQVFTIHNHQDFSQNFEVYYMTPKKDTVRSPVYDYCATIQGGDSEIVANNAEGSGQAYNAYHPSRAVFGNKEFRNRWRCIKKRTFKLCGKGSLRVVCKVPLSLVNYEKIMQAKGGDTDVSLAGLTGWFYVKAYGIFGHDSQGYTDGATTTINNFVGLSYAPCQFLINCEQRVTVLRQHKGTRALIDLRASANDNYTKYSYSENDENSETKHE